MKEFLIRAGDDGMITDLLELDEENESYLSDDCDGCDQLEAALLAIISSLREEINMLKARVSDLEKRPILEAEPLYPAFDHLVRPWIITYSNHT